MLFELQTKTKKKTFLAMTKQLFHAKLLSAALVCPKTK